MSNSDNTLLNNRRNFTARQSMDSIINFARLQDEKIVNRSKRFQYSRALGLFSIFLFPGLFLVHNFTVGYWRSLYHSSLMSTPFEVKKGNLREYFVPEMYLKEQEIRKIELGLKDTQELRTLFHKKD